MEQENQIPRRKWEMPTLVELSTIDTQSGSLPSDFEGETEVPLPGGVGFYFAFDADPSN